MLLAPACTLLEMVLPSLPPWACPTHSRTQSASLWLL